MEDAKETGIPGDLAELLALAYILLWRRSMVKGRMAKWGNVTGSKFNQGQTLLGYTQRRITAEMACNLVLGRKESLPCDLMDLAPITRKRRNPQPSEIGGKKSKASKLTTIPEQGGFQDA